MPRFVSAAPRCLRTVGITLSIVSLTATARAEGPETLLDAPAAGRIEVVVPAEHAEARITMRTTGGTETERLAALRDGLAAFEAAAADRADLDVVVGPAQVQPSRRKSWSLGSGDPEWGSRPVQHLSLVTRLEPGDDLLVASQRIIATLGTVSLSESAELVVDEVTLGLGDVERLRPRLLEALHARIEATRAALGDGMRVEVRGLERDLVVRPHGRRSVVVSLDHELSLRE